ncbi:hypothetical protein GCM10007160_12170 [Litchfieldella qijiaojingensis]|uniref:Succinate dehydrogenase subunit 3 n=1 Tax=Litchfieldella qijiaojingensis TaxID=980347 RepID=A0ABQ2YJG7_9GAMM|nr:hypothetical protein [Halomonas qijiaojingensis]GGX86445.1 hypothetical protein GCM10007160_12170 [Halomonas qijiaojingensis]
MVQWLGKQVQRREVIEMSQTEPLQASQKPAPRDYVVEATLMLLAVVPVLISAYASFVTGEGHWFQRSGALMILFSIGVEYHRSQVMHCVDPECLDPGEVRPFGRSQMLARLITRFWRSTPYVCYLAIVMGTLIWSYGDLLFS